MKQRLDKELVSRNLVATRSQAENYIKLGQVELNGSVASKPGDMVTETDRIKLLSTEQYVSRAGLKLASVAEKLNLDFAGQIVLDVGSSTGGFSDYALQHGAKKIVAVDVGTNQLHPTLRNDSRVELHEQTDIRAFKANDDFGLIVADLSFISLREILPYLTHIAGKRTLLAIMVKPQFEAGKTEVNKGVIKNDKIRRDILKSFESWVQKLYVIIDKADSEVAGAKGNRERFYLLRKA